MSPDAAIKVRIRGLTKTFHTNGHEVRVLDVVHPNLTVERPGECGREEAVELAPARPPAETRCDDNIWNVAMVEAGKRSDQEGRTVAIAEVFPDGAP